MELGLPVSALAPTRQNVVPPRLCHHARTTRLKICKLHKLIGNARNCQEAIKIHIHAFTQQYIRGLRNEGLNSNRLCAVGSSRFGKTCRMVHLNRPRTIYESVSFSVIGNQFGYRQSTCVHLHHILLRRFPANCANGSRFTKQAGEYGSTCPVEICGASS